MIGAVYAPGPNAPGKLCPEENDGELTPQEPQTFHGDPAGRTTALAVGESARSQRLWRHHNMIGTG